MKRYLLVVDPQNDFITGSLAVAGAETAMNNLINYLESPCEEDQEPFEEILITLDTHPENHSSFKKNGGIWPEHCVCNPLEGPISEGWQIYEPLRQSLSEINPIGFYKGMDVDKEEYSIFDNEAWGEVLKDILTKNKDIEVWVAGIAGDYCVLETLKGLLQVVPIENVVIMTEMIASIDKGEALNEFVKTHKLRTYDYCD